jgi:hypothetical protein
MLLRAAGMIWEISGRKIDHIISILFPSKHNLAFRAFRIIQSIGYSLIKWELMERAD